MFSATIPANPAGGSGGSKGREKLSLPEGLGSLKRVLTPGSALAAILGLSQPRRLGASESRSSLPPLPPPPPLPSSSEPRSRAGLEPPAPTPLARFIQLHSERAGAYVKAGGDPQPMALQLELGAGGGAANRGPESPGSQVGGGGASPR